MFLTGTGNFNKASHNIKHTLVQLTQGSVGAKRRQHLPIARKEKEKPFKKNIFSCDSIYIRLCTVQCTQTHDKRAFVSYLSYKYAHL